MPFTTKCVKKATSSRTRLLTWCLGVDLEGRKDVLGIWIGQSESSKFWLGVLNDLKARGVQYVLVFSTDNLKGFSEAIAACFPQSDIQKCIVHQIRNSLRDASYKDFKAVSAALKPIYQAPAEEAARMKLEKFEETWGARLSTVRKVMAGQLVGVGDVLPLSGRDATHHVYDEHHRGLPQATSQGDERQEHVPQR